MNILDIYQKEIHMSDPVPEYRLIYHWDAEHWTCITTGDTPVDICDYVKKHLEEMQEAMEVSEDAYFSIEHRYSRAPMNIWHGTPEELLEVIKEISDSWLSLAFQ